MTLATLQRAFQAHLMTGDNSIAALVQPAMQRGLPVYAFAYRATLRAALHDTYAKTLLWLGEDTFNASASAYIDAAPSRSWTLSDYGSGFADHLCESMPDDPEVAEIAWLDWALRASFAAGALMPTDPDSLASIDWETARLALAPHLAFRSVETNVIDVWKGLPDAPVAATRLAAPAGLVVWRHDLTPEFRSADPLEVEALGILARGQSFATMCAALVEKGSGVDKIGSYLSRWLSDRIVSALV